MMYKDKGIIYSNYVIERLNYLLQDKEDITIKVETFYNCREQGYVLSIHSRDNWDFNKGWLYIWIYAHRNSDDPTITWGNERGTDNMFNNESWVQRTKTYSKIEDLVEKAYNLVKDLK